MQTYFTFSLLSYAVTVTNVSGRCSAAPADLPLTRSSLCLDDRKCKIAFVYRHADVMSGCCERETFNTCMRMEMLLSCFMYWFILQFCCCLLPALTCCFPPTSPREPRPKYENAVKLETALSVSSAAAICATAQRLNTRCNKKNTTPADGCGQLPSPSVCPAIDYPSAGGHKWPVIIWLRIIYPTCDLSLGVNQINPPPGAAEHDFAITRDLLLLHAAFIASLLRGKTGRQAMESVAKSPRLTGSGGKKMLTNGLKKYDVNQWQAQ